MLGERQSGLKPPNNFIRNDMVILGSPYWATPNGTRAWVLEVGKSLHGTVAQTCYASSRRRSRFYRPESRSSSAVLRSICRMRRPGKSILDDYPGAGRSGPHGESIIAW